MRAATIFLALGLASIALSALGLLEERSVLHLLSVGAIACMMLAVMTRASLGHTGRPLQASRLTVAAYGALILCALTRPLGEVFPEASHLVYAASGSVVDTTVVAGQRLMRGGEVPWLGEAVSHAAERAHRLGL